MDRESLKKYKNPAAVVSGFIFYDIWGAIIFLVLANIPWGFLKKPLPTLYKPLARIDDTMDVPEAADIGNLYELSLIHI